MSAITCVAWYWVQSNPPLYTVDDVYLLKRMVERNLTIPHEWICVTDRPHEFDSNFRTVPLCERTHRPGALFDKVEMFRPDSRFGDRAISFDTDCVVTGSLDAIAGRGENLVMWRNPCRIPWEGDNTKAGQRPLYNGSMILITKGARPSVWHEFSHEGYRGDQYYLSDKLSRYEQHWSQADGVYRLAREDTPGSGIVDELPENARIVFFAGSCHKPHLPVIKTRYPWIETFRK